MTIQVLKTGLQTTVQDLGRMRSKHIGIPQSGSFDYLSAAKANAILNRPINSPVLECTMTGPSLKFSEDMDVCITGATVNQITVDDSSINQNTSVHVKKGSILSTDIAKDHLRFYIAFSKSIQATEFLNSVSTYLPAKFGGLNGATIQKGQMIDFKETQSEAYTGDPWIENGERIETSKIRVTKGPEFNLLDASSVLFETDFIVSNDSNRMGVRTVNNRIPINDQGSMISKPIYPGIVQCPQDGLPIILGADAQTLGGYPRILQVIKAERHLIGQLRPNDHFRFELVSITEALDAWENLKINYPFVCEL